MKYLVLFLFSFSVNAASLFDNIKQISESVFMNTPSELIASKCRLNLPVKKAQCVAVGIHPSRVKGGQLEGLPVSALKYGDSLTALKHLPNKKEYQFLKGQ